MKRSFTVPACLLLLLLGFISCSTDRSSPTNTSTVHSTYSVEQFALVSLNLGYNESGELSTIVNWDIFGNPLPAFNYVAIDDTMLTEARYFPGQIGSYFPYISVGMDTLYQVEVNTSYGSLLGSITMPDTVYNVIADHDTLPLGGDLTMTWSGGNGNFTYVTGSYGYYISGGYQSVPLDTCVVGNTVTFPGEIFGESGEIYFWSFDPYNGSLPQPGAVGNLTGNGAGFLYARNTSGSSSNITITVGAGSSEMGASRLKSLSAAGLRSRQEQFLKRRLGLFSHVIEEQENTPEGGAR